MLAIQYYNRGEDKWVTSALTHYGAGAAVQTALKLAESLQKVRILDLAEGADPPLVWEWGVQIAERTVEDEL